MYFGKNPKDLNKKKRNKKQMKIQLEHIEILPNSSVEEISKAILTRFGLIPRKKDGQAQFHKLLLELYERKKRANREKRPEKGVMTVEEMGFFAGIKRQTMYDYLGRWTKLSILKKTSFVLDGKVIIGYELNGLTLEMAFKKAEYTIKNHLDESFNLIRELQNEIKKEKLRHYTNEKTAGTEPEKDIENS